MFRTARAIVNRFKMPLVTRNEWGKFDGLLVSGEAIPARDTLAEVLAETPHPCLVHFPATGEFDLRECPECSGRGERLYADGYESGGCPNWVMRPCGCQGMAVAA